MGMHFHLIYIDLQLLYSDQREEKEGKEGNRRYVSESHSTSLLDCSDRISLDGNRCSLSRSLETGRLPFAEHEHVVDSREDKMINANICLN